MVSGRHDENERQRETERETRTAAGSEENGPDRPTERLPQLESCLLTFPMIDDDGTR